MSETENRDQRVAANERHIEEAVDHLDQTVEEAREAVLRAKRADSLASPGVENAVSDAEPAGDEQEREREGGGEREREENAERRD